MADPALAQITEEKSWYVGDYISNLLLGIQISLVIQSTYYLAYGHYTPKRKAFFIGYSILLLVLVGIAGEANNVQGLLMWITHRDVAGGPEAYLAETFSAWWDILGTSAVVASDFMANVLWIYRCYILLSSNIWLTILPALILTASTVLSVLTVVESALPNATVFTGLSESFGVPWIALTVAFNVVVTSLICGRILLTYFMVKRDGDVSNVLERFGIIAILIESSLPFSVFGIIFAVFYGLNSPLVSAFADVWGGIVGLAPQLVILRVAMGQAWTRNSLNSRGLQSTPLQFRNHGSSTRVTGNSEMAVASREKFQEQDSAQSGSNITYAASETV